MQSGVSLKRKSIFSQWRIQEFARNLLGLGEIMFDLVHVGEEINMLGDELRAMPESRAKRD